MKELKRYTMNLNDVMEVSRHFTLQLETFGYWEFLKDTFGLQDVAASVGYKTWRGNSKIKGYTLMENHTNYLYENTTCRPLEVSYQLP